MLARLDSPHFHIPSFAHIYISSFSSSLVFQPYSLDNLTGTPCTDRREKGKFLFSEACFSNANQACGYVNLIVQERTRYLFAQWSCQCKLELDTDLGEALGYMIQMDLWTLKGTDCNYVGGDITSITSIDSVKGFFFEGGCQNIVVLVPSSPSLMGRILSLSSCLWDSQNHLGGHSMNRILDLMGFQSDQHGSSYISWEREVWAA